MQRDSESLTQILARPRGGRTAACAMSAAGLLLFAAQPLLAAPLPAKAKPRTLLAPPTVATDKVTTETVRAGYRLRGQALGAFQPVSSSSMGLDVSRFAFTAPGKSAGTRMQTIERGFSFTPSGAPAGKGVTLAMTTRATAPTAARTAAPVEMGIAPSAYNFDLSVGYKGFAVTGGVSRADTGLGGGLREGVDVGLSYAARNFRTDIRGIAERAAPLAMGRGLPSERYGVEAGGALALSPGISVGGTVRYRLAPLNPTVLDPAKDDRAVFVGGQVAF